MAEIALITGATGGLGAPMARLLASSGYHVAVHFNSNDGRARSLVSEIISSGGMAFAVDGNLAGPDRDVVADRIVNEVIANLGSIELLVNNAADQSSGNWLKQSAQESDQILAGTYGSAVAMTRACQLVMHAGTSIVNVSSVESGRPFPNHAHYAAAKAALQSFTLSAAADLAGKGIRVNAVVPGLIGSDDLETTWPVGLAWWNKTSMLGRPVSADEVASAVLYLGRSSGVTGSSVVVDGGWCGASGPIA